MAHTKLPWKCRGPFVDDRICEYYEIYNEDGETESYVSDEFGVPGEEDSEFII